MVRRSIQKTFVLAGALGLLLGLGASAQNATDGATVQVAQHDAHGAHLVDAQGRSLYVNTNDPEGGTSCTDSCASTFPPITVEGEPTAGEGIDAALLGTMQRPDGLSQVTYGGRPLYRFAREVAGMTAGHRAGGVWYLVSPEAMAIGAPDPSAEADGGEGADPMLVAELQAEGKDVFAAQCAACHGERGGGGQGPALAGNDALDDRAYVVRQIKNGSRFMPPFGSVLSSRELAAVATFIRTSWGNEFGPVLEGGNGQNGHQ